MPAQTRQSARKPSRARRDSADDGAGNAADAAEVIPAPSAPSSLHRTDTAAWQSKEIRYKVTIWELHGDKIDLVEGNFEAKFRVTLFWEPQHFREVTELTERHLAELNNQLKWEHFPRTRDKASFNNGQASLTEDVPPISLINAIERVTPEEGGAEYKAEVSSIKPRPDGPVLMRWTCMYKGKFYLPSVPGDGLQFFPYDVHTLQITIGVQFGEFQKKPWEPARKEDNMKGSNKPGYTPHGHIECALEKNLFLVNKDMKVFCEPDAGNPRVKCQITIWRKHQYWETNVILLNSVISSLGLYAYSLDVTNFQERSDVILAVLFGVVGLRSTVDENLPKLEYSTLCVYILNSSYYMLMIAFMEMALCQVVGEAHLGCEFKPLVYRNTSDSSPSGGSSSPDRDSSAPVEREFGIKTPADYMDSHFLCYWLKVLDACMPFLFILAAVYWALIVLRVRKMHISKQPERIASKVPISLNEKLQKLRLT